MPVIALLTDFGLRDHYVAAMKGMILQINPKATLVDVCHEIGSQDLFHGAFVLRQVLPYFPPETVFVAVVDPGVGSGRRILAARYSNRFVLAPDNGLLTLVHRDAELQDIRVVENRRYFASTISSTFHGRDIFAPVAAHLSRGVALAEFGPRAQQVHILSIAQSVRQPDGNIAGQVMLVDRFGNLITNISELDISAARAPRRGKPWEVFLGDRRIGPIQTTYADVGPGEPVALIGSSHLLEIAVNGGSAAEQFAAGAGAAVQLR
ncbi:MAG: SAM-dependent chlorinase/fluorinase [Phycisphaerae bacterium]